MRTITRGLFMLLYLAFLPATVAEPLATTGTRAANELWQCFGTCMPGCQQSAGLVTRDPTVTDVLAPNECEDFCKRACDPSPERSFELADFFTIIDETEIDRFTIASDDGVLGEVTCQTIYWCQCSGASTCNDFIARCAGKGNNVVCTDYDSEGRPINCQCFKDY